MTFPKIIPQRAEQLQMLPLSDFLWPVSFTYLMDTSWGSTQQTLTVDSPLQYDDAAATVRLGRMLWNAVVAPATSSSTRLSLMSVTSWKGLGVSVPHPVAEMRGQRLALTTAREDTPQMVMLTGHGDNAGRRRLFMPGAPRDWVANGLLTSDGWLNMMQQARGLVMGMGYGSPLYSMNWLIAYPGVLAPQVGNVTGVAFRFVRHVRVCWHADKAPEPSGLDSL